MPYKDPNRSKEYMKAWYNAHKESENAKSHLTEEFLKKARSI